MYNVFINTHTRNTSAETLKNIQPGKSLEHGVGLISLLPLGMKHSRRHADYYCALSFIEKLLQRFHFKSAKKMVKEIMTFLKVTGLQAVAVKQFGLKKKKKKQ